MKNRSVFSASILFILFSITASALPGLPLDWGHSEISNFNFEAWSSGTVNTAPDGWTLTDSNYQSCGRSSDSCIQSYSYYITSNGVGSATSSITRSVSITPGYYTIGAWVKTSGSSGALNVDMLGSGIDITGVRVSNLQEWTYCEATEYIDYTGTLTLRIFADGSPVSGSTFYVDGLTVYKSGNANLDTDECTFLFTEDYINITISYTPDGFYNPSVLAVFLEDISHYIDDVGKLGTVTAVYTTDDITFTPTSSFRAKGSSYQAKNVLYVGTSGFTPGVQYNITVSIPFNQPPNLYYPENGTVIESNYPDYNKVILSWEDCANQYYGVISKYSDFSTIWYESTIQDAEWDVTLDSGTYYWKIQAYDEVNEQYSEPSVGTFSIGNAPSKPGYAKIYAKNESTGVNLTNFSVDLYNDTTYITKSTTTGSIEFSSSEIVEGEYIAKIYANGYSPRWRIIESPETITAYLAAEDMASLISFNLIDYTNQFKYRETKLLITRPADAGTLTISENYFDAAGLNKVYLENNVNYDLTLQTTSLERSVGPYVATQTDFVSLVVGDIELIPPSTVYGGFNYSIQKTNESVILTWTAPAGSLYSPFIYNITDTSSGEMVYSISSIAPQGIATFNYPSTEKQYYIQFWANTSGGELLHQEYCRSDQQLIDLQVSDYWYNVVSFFILATFGLLFGYRSSKIGAFLTSILALGLYVAGFLRVSEAIAAFVVVLGLLAILGGRKQ